MTPELLECACDCAWRWYSQAWGAYHRAGVHDRLRLASMTEALQRYQRLLCRRAVLFAVQRRRVRRQRAHARYPLGRL